MSSLSESRLSWMIYDRLLLLLLRIYNTQCHRITLSHHGLVQLWQNCLAAQCTCHLNLISSPVRHWRRFSLGVDKTPLRVCVHTWESHATYLRGGIVLYRALQTLESNVLSEFILDPECVICSDLIWSKRSEFGWNCISNAKAEMMILKSKIYIFLSAQRQIWQRG